MYVYEHIAQNTKRAQICVEAQWAEHTEIKFSHTTRFVSEHNWRTELSRPSVISIRKKMRDQNVETGSVEIASGYTTNTRPGPAANTRAASPYRRSASTNKQDVGPVSTYCAAVRLTFAHLSWKLTDWGTFTQILEFLMTFRFWVKRSYVRDGQINTRTDGKTRNAVH